MSDIKTQTNNETTALFADLDKPSLHGLSYALRHPDTWPEGFIWNYGNCDQCAMGLARQLWQSIPSANKTTGASLMAHKFAIPYSAAENIFMGSGRWVPRKPIENGWRFWRPDGLVQDFRAVTPDMVADEIDTYLAHAE